MLRAAVILLAVSALVATTLAGARLERMERVAPPEELLYLPNGELLRVMSLGHPSLLADAVYIWAIQYYSNYERRDRYRYVEHVFDRVITELDPRYIDAYWLGALILILEAGDVDAGLRLLDKGVEKNPDEWILLYVAGWEAYHAGHGERAQEYFERAVRIPGAPSELKRLVAGLEARTGDALLALEMWIDIRKAAQDWAAQDIADRQIQRLTVKILERAVERFRIDNERLPFTLEELVQTSYIRSVPRDASGRPLAYDPMTGVVTHPAGRVLGDS